MAIIQGKDLRLKIYNEDSEVPEKVYHSTSCEVEFDAEFDEIVTKDTGGYSESVPKSKSIGISGDALAVDGDSPNNDHNLESLVDAQMSQKKISYEVLLGGDYSGNWKITGQCYVKSVSVSAPADGNATASYTLQPTGAPAKSAIN